jgi:hypothetical protein
LLHELPDFELVIAGGGDDRKLKLSRLLQNLEFDQYSVQDADD